MNRQLAELPRAKLMKTRRTSKKIYYQFADDKCSALR